MNVRYLYGVFLIRKGWVARGKGAISSISAEDLDTFINALQRAEFVLSPILDTPSQLKAIVLEQLLLIYKGVAKREEAEDLYAQHAPNHKTALPLHIIKLGQMAARWGGDHEQMFNVARNISKNGQLMAVALAAAWIEYASDESKKSMKKNLEQSEDQALILRAYQKMSRAPKSLMSMEDYDLVLANNIYAAYFHLLGDKKRTKDALRKTAGYYIEYPWKYLHADAKEAYTKALIEAKVTTFH